MSSQELLVVDCSHSANDKYGEVHTGEAWIPARNRYCKVKTDMPVALIVFADKSHTDLHGALSLTPIEIAKVHEGVFLP